MRIKIDKADETFSIYIRIRDKRCVRCGKPGQEDSNGRPILGLECSHYFGRARETTRFDPDNCDALCFGCHRYWETQNREEYRDFKIQQLGKKGFEKLRIRAEMIGKKDREAAYLYAKELLRAVDK